MHRPHRAHVQTLLTLAVVAVAALSPPVAAQETIASDRPGIGSGSFVLGSGTLQVETGMQYASSTAAHAYSIGQALVRLGTPKVELELFLNSFVSTGSDSGALDRDGFQDLALGAKLPVAQGIGGRANLSLQALLTLPTGSDAFSGDELSPALVALTDIGLGDRAGVAVNLGYQVIPGAASDVTTLIITPAVSLGGGVGAYGGWAGAFSAGADTHIAEAGMTYLPSADVQLDVNGGWDVDRDDWFLGLGVALRRVRR